MKRIMIKKAMTMIATFALLVTPVNVLAETIYTEGTLYYTINNSSITITGCFGKDEKVTVPSMIAGIPVNNIAAGAFTTNQYVKKVILPDTITTIQEGAFTSSVTVEYQQSTTTTTVPKEDSSNTTSGSSNNSNSSSNVIVQDGNKTSSTTTNSAAAQTTQNTGNNNASSTSATNSRNKLIGKQLTIDNCKITVLSNSTVSYTSKAKAKTVIVPSTVKINGVSYKVTKIAKDAFNNKAKTITLGKNITTITKEAFKGDKKLKTLKITSKSLTVSKNAFKGLTKKQKRSIKVTVSKKKMSKANYNKLVKQLVKAGIKKSNIKRK